MNHSKVCDEEVTILAGHFKINLLRIFDLVECGCTDVNWKLSE